MIKLRKSSTFKFRILWTIEAANGLEQILNYLAYSWSDKEVIDFKRKFNRLLVILQKFPNLFPVSPSHPDLRKVVLNKYTILIYEVNKREIILISIFDSRQNKIM